MPNNILVWPSKFVLGVKNLDGPHIDKNGKTFRPELGHPYTIQEALDTEHPSDAHMTLFVLKEKDGTIVPAIPLLSKSTLKSVRAEGGDLLLTAAALDWDTPGHITLTPELLCNFLTKFLAACAADERLAKWRSYYTTRHGCRVVYELEEPVPVDDGERRILSILNEFKRQDLRFDTACRDWTRRFRLPKVVRDNIHTKDESMFALETQDVLLDLREFRKADWRTSVNVTPFRRSDKIPSQDDCNALLSESGAQGKGKMTRFHKKAKAVIKKTCFYDNIYSENVPFCGDTGRNEFFGKILGVLIPMLLDSLQATPEQVFALFRDPLEELEQFSGKQHPSEHFWNMLQDIYEREHSLFVSREEARAEAVEEGQSTMERMIAGMKQWCDDERLFSEDTDEVEGFIRRHIFANLGKFYYPMDQDGWYSNHCLMRDQLVSTIRTTYLANIIETQKTDLKGELISVSPTELVNSHSTVVSEIKMSPLQGARGRISGLDTFSPSLTLPMYQRNEFLKAEYNGAVDGWLRHLFGHSYAEAAKWVGYALAFEEGPICAISISGSGSVGKKMFTEGLAECLLVPWTATGHDMIGRENSGMIKTPFLVVNEGLPKARDKSASDTFKELTAGDPIRVRELYKPPVNVLNPMRLIFTANDHSVLQEISRGKELTPQTRKAMGERLLHFDVGDDAEQYLRRLGGRAFTTKEGARWIRGDSDEPSDYVVAKHFLYLYQNKPPRNPADRYCVMGNCNEAESFQIASQSEFLPAVIRGIVGLCERPGQLKKHVALTVKGSILVTIQGVLSYIRDINQEQISERAMEGVLKSLYKETKAYDRDGLFYYKLNPGAIMDWAKPRGLPCEKIEKMYELSKRELP